MSTQQPIWKQVAQLGDVHPLDYGGLFVYVDETGVYPPEMEKVTPNSEDDDSLGWEIRRCVLENLKTVAVDDSVFIVPAKFDDTWPHPVADYDEWFHKHLDQVAAYVGQEVEEMRTNLCSSNPVDRAYAWQAIGDYHGWDNLDSYPVTFTDRAELETRYAAK